MRSLGWTAGESFFTFFDLTKNPMLRWFTMRWASISSRAVRVSPPRADDGGRRLR